MDLLLYFFYVLHDNFVTTTTTAAVAVVVVVCAVVGIWQLNLFLTSPFGLRQVTRIMLGVHVWP